MDNLEPTDRSTVRRNRKRAVTDRAALHALLADALLVHVGVASPHGPLVLPSAFGVDLDGPDDGGSLYLHGSVASPWLRAAGQPVCVTVTELDGLVAGRSGFHHSMNYRCAVVLGTARDVTDAKERDRALDAIVDQMIPGRSATLRPSTRKELAATAVLAVPLREASVKVRSGGPNDEPEDVAGGIWGGHVPVRRVLGDPVPDGDAHGDVPAEVRALVQALVQAR
ncbi:pyridoxamine 5'-phosphate oxidase family protein [Paraoerskovia marina]|uniref:pyridoxamine 5'-phosphate oxidase family protein n=1 Tax=Paraoerskovia marina TaxID=545619 RepID=UPI0004923C74|nr:pyridoxamine 5'-phosphate oxidase family protein [Paraoerskovia marina]